MRIELTQNQFALVDDRDFEYISQWKWGAWWNPETGSFYARRNYRNIKTYLMHRVIANTPKGMICDHINHDTLDNRRCNLRNVTPSQSNMNRKPKYNSLGEPNIRPMGNGFEVRMNINKIPIICKTFPTLEEAIQVRDGLIRKYHKEFSFSGDKK